MITTKKPYGAINSKSIKCRYKDNGKFYAIDKGYNKLEISESEYNKLKCPVWKRGLKD